MPNPVVHFEIQSQNPEQARAFYGDLFDWRIKHVPEMNYGLVETGAGRGINGGIGASNGHGNLVTVYVEVDDPQTYLDKVESVSSQSPGATI